MNSQRYTGKSLEKDVIELNAKLEKLGSDLFFDVGYRYNYTTIDLANSTTTENADPMVQAIEMHIQNIIDCDGGTILGPWAHDLYFRKDYHDTQCGPARFAIYYVGENKSELRATQSTLEGAEKYIGAYCVLVILKAHDWQADRKATWDKIIERSN